MFAIETADKIKFVNAYENTFRSNVGQWKNKEILFSLITEESSISFLKNSIAFSLRRELPILNTKKNNQKQEELFKYEYLVWDISFEGANPCSPLGEASKPSVYRFISNGEKEGKLIGLYEKVVYNNLYPGIDLVFYIDSKNQVKYDFVVGPGADASQIKIKYTGIEALEANKDGSLEIKTAWGHFRENAPFSFQDEGGNKSEVLVNYSIASNNVLSFNIKGNYKTSQTLTIDPVLFDWSTYFYNTGYTICAIEDLDVDSDGNAVVTGRTREEYWVVPGSYDTSFTGTGTDAFIAKINKRGDSLIFFTYIGGNGSEWPLCMDMNASNDIVIASTTNSMNMATAGVFDSSYSPFGNCFIAKLNAKGSALIFLTYFKNYGTINDIVLNDKGQVFFAGTTSNYIASITSNAYQISPKGKYEGFFAKLKPDASGLYYCSYFGGSDEDLIHAMAVNKKGEIYLTGRTKSSDFPITTYSNTSFNKSCKGNDGFIAKFDTTGNKLGFCNLIGGSGDEWFSSICLNVNEDIYLAGTSNSSDFPATSGSFQNKLKMYADNVIVKLEPTGNGIRYSTYLGGSSDDAVFNSERETSIAVNAADELWLASTTRSSDFPVTSDGFQSKNKSSGSTATLSKLSSGGNKLIYSSYFGGSVTEASTGLNLVQEKCVTNIFLGGWAYSKDFPSSTGTYRTKPPKDSTFGNGSKYVSFIAKFGDTLKTVKPDFGLTNQIWCNNFSFVLDALNPGASYKWSTGDSSRILNVHKAGTYWVKTSYGCDTKGDTVIVQNPITSASFTVADTVLCFTNNVFHFKETTSYKDDKRQISTWYFGDGSSVVNSIVNKTYSKSGSFIVKLVAKGKLGCKDSMIKKVVVNPSTLVNFGISDSIQCFNNHSFDFKNNTMDNGNVTYQWDLGDTSFSNQHDITNKKYLKDSTFNMQLIATKDNRCKDTLRKRITILQSPKADFSWDLACSRTITNFKYIGSKPILYFHWNFNNQDTSSLENPVHLFATAGTSIATLTLISTNGCNDSIIKFIDVKTQSKADFMANDVCENNYASFNNMSKDAGNYNWKFGDGTNSSVESPKHQYQIARKSTTFNVTLVAIVPNGCSDSVSKAITVNANPQSDFNYIIVGNQVNFTATETAATQFQWDFGDGGTADVIIPKTNYNYSKFPSGKYTTCLKVTNAANCFSETCKEINIAGEVSTLSKSIGFKLYPNPNTGSFSIEIENPSKDVSIEIFNLLGEQVGRVEKVGKVNSLDLDVADGMYWVKVKNGHSVWNQKVSILNSK